MIGQMNMEGVKSHYLNYKKIAIDLGYVEEIINNMRCNSYSSLDTYLNNIKITSDFFEKINPYMSDKKFVDYFKCKDADKYIKIISIGNSIVFMTNLLVNLEHDLKCKKRELSTAQ